MAFQRSESPTAPLSPAGPDEFRHAGFCHEAIEGLGSSALYSPQHQCFNGTTAQSHLLPHSDGSAHTYAGA